MWKLIEELKFNIKMKHNICYGTSVLSNDLQFKTSLKYLLIIILSNKFFHLWYLIIKILYKVAVKLENQISGEPFATAPIDTYPGVAVESVTDSSRFISYLKFKKIINLVNGLIIF